MVSQNAVVPVTNTEGMSAVDPLSTVLLFRQFICQCGSESFLYMTKARLHREAWVHMDRAPAQLLFTAEFP